MNVFIAGPRAVSFLDENVQNRLCNIIEKRFTILVGDATGVDKSVQQFLFTQHYNNIRVFASRGKARNNIGNWQVQNVPVASGVTGFDFFAAKDLSMAENADYGFMIWNGESKGTLNNIINLTNLGKTTLLYLMPDKEFFTINTMSDIQDVIVHCGNSAIKLFSALTNSSETQTVSHQEQELALFA
jgi:hypothetical protein